MFIDRRPNLFAAALMMLTIAFASATLTSCGDDSDDDKDTEKNDNDGTENDIALEDHCPGELDADIEPALCTISGGEYTEDYTWIEDIQYLLDGRVFIGDGDGETTLTIEPGTLILGNAGDKDGAALIIQKNSKIMAVGKEDNPIVFSSSKEEGKRAEGDWGGLVINGNAPINVCDKKDCESEGEGETGMYGGTDKKDNSGVLKYVRIEFSGKQLTEDSEFNGLALQGVGSGTTIDYIQIHRTSDDSLEFFGGTAEVSHMLLTGCGDDGFDWTQGWSGKAQYVVIEQADDIETNRGIEADNLSDNNDAEPRANPTLSNFTIIGSPKNTGDTLGVMLREGTAGTLKNFVITGFEKCIDVDHDATWAQADSGKLSIDYSLVESDDCFAVDDDESSLVKDDFFDKGSHNIIDDPDLDGWVPSSGSPVLGAGDSSTGADFMGAIGDEDWTDGGWTDFPEN